MADDSQQVVQLAPAASASAAIVSSSEGELAFKLAPGQSGYLVEVGNRASFSAPQSSYSQKFAGGETLQYEIQTGESVLPSGCALYLLVFDNADNRLQQFRASIGGRDVSLKVKLEANARKGCFALRLTGSGKFVPTKIKISKPSVENARSDNNNTRQVALKKKFPQSYRTDRSLTDYLPAIVDNISHFERVAIRERSMRTRELLARSLTGGAVSYGELISLLQSTTELGSAGPVRGMLRFDDKALRALLGLAHVVHAQRLRSEDATEALDLYEAVAGIDARMFRQIDWIPYVLLLAEHRSANAALEKLRKARFDNGNQIEPALLMSNILRKRARERGIDPKPSQHLLAINRLLQSARLEPIGAKNAAATPFQSLDTGMLDSFVSDGPKISVLMTTFNPDETLDVAMRSVLGQSWRNLELIVIDDCSEADRFAAVKRWEQIDPRVRVLRTPSNQGTYSAKNLGLSVAEGEFVTCHDSDDWSHPRKLEFQMEVLAGAPPSVAVLSHWVRVTSDLAFQLFSASGFLCYENLSSLLYRREAAMGLVGYYDAVRTGADSEFKKRLERASGQATLSIGKVPLSFGLLHERSLTATSLGLGWFSPERQDYRIAARYWLDTLGKAEGGYMLERNPPKRPFAVRKSLLPDRAALAGGKSHYDVIIMSDFRMVGGNTLSSIEELKAQCRAGLKTAICQVGSFRKGVFAREHYSGAIHQMLNAGEIDHIELTSDVSAKLINIRYPAIFQFADGLTTNIKADEIQIIVNQPPAEADSRDRRYDVGECMANIARLFGISPKWFPIGPSVRDALNDVPRDLLAESDWFNIIDADEWAVPRENFVGERPVIGRHGRDDISKWPETAETLYAAYPNDARYPVRILGGAQAIKEAGFTIPPNWDVTAFNRTSPAEFLKTIDFFVYFHHSQRIEAFGRTVIEAMASGCVTILPRSFEPLFGGAAIYCEPREVTSIVDMYYADPAMYRVQSQKATQFVRENFGYEMHIGRLARLGIVASRDEASAPS